MYHFVLRSLSDRQLFATASKYSKKDGEELVGEGLLLLARDPSISEISTLIEPLPCVKNIGFTIQEDKYTEAFQECSKKIQFLPTQSNIFIVRLALAKIILTYRNK
jgi:hypothetical protein